MILSGTQPGQPPGGMQTIMGTFPDVLFRYDSDWPYFFTYFLAGWTLYRLRANLSLIGHSALPVLAASIGLQILARQLQPEGGGFPFFGQPTPLNAASVGRYFVFALAVASTGWGLMGVYQKWLSHPTKWARYFAETAFWIYLVHQDLLNMAVLGWVRPLKLPALPQALLAVAITVGIALVSFELIIRRTPLSMFFGGSSQAKKRKPAATQAVALEPQPNAQIGA